MKVEGNLKITKENAGEYTKLESVGGYLFIRAEAQLPVLTSVGGYLFIRAEAQLPVLTSVGGNLDIRAEAQLPVLTSVGGYPVVPKDQQIANCDKVREIILDNRALLEMGHWHAEESNWKDRSCIEEAMCGTTHCFAGWAQVCSTDPAMRDLEPALAGAILLGVDAAKLFHTDEGRVLEYLQKREYAA